MAGAAGLGPRTFLAIALAAFAVALVHGADVSAEQSSSVPFLIKPNEKIYAKASTPDGTTTCTLRASTIAPKAASDPAVDKVAPAPSTKELSLDDARKAVLDSLSGCIDGNDALGYRYYICFGPGATVRQGGLGEDNLVGKFAGGSKDGIAFVFEGGDNCAETAAPRRGRVDFSCEAKLGVLGVKESQKCVYSFYVGTPLVCGDSRFNVVPVRVEQSLAQRTSGGSANYPERWLLEAHVVAEGDVLCRASLVALETFSLAPQPKSGLELEVSTTAFLRLEVLGTTVRELSRALVDETTVRTVKETQHRVVLDVTREDASSVAHIQAVVRGHKQ